MSKNEVINSPCIHFKCSSSGPDALISRTNVVGEQPQGDLLNVYTPVITIRPSRVMPLIAKNKALICAYSLRRTVVVEEEEVA